LEPKHTDVIVLARSGCETPKKRLVVFGTGAEAIGGDRTVHSVVENAEDVIER
jgi:hypothetical protein